MHLLVYQGGECTTAIYIRYTSFILERINCSEFENMRLLNERQRNQLTSENRRKLHSLKENTVKEDTLYQYKKIEYEQFPNGLKNVLIMSFCSGLQETRISEKSHKARKLNYSKY